MEELGQLEYKVLGFKSILAERRCAYEEAWGYAERGVAASVGQNASERFWSVANLAVLAGGREQKPPDEARIYVDEMVRLAPSVPVRHAEAYCWLASLESRLGNLSAADRALEEFRRVWRAQGRKSDESDALDVRFNQLEEAEQPVEAARSYAEAIGDPAGLPGVLDWVGSVNCARHRDDLARQCWQEGAGMSRVYPGRSYCCEVHVLLLDFLHDAVSEARLDALEKRPHASRPDMARMLAALRAFLAARAGDPERAVRCLEEGNRSSAWGGPPAWSSLVTALTDIAHATKLGASDNLLDARKYQDSAREKLRAAPVGGEVALLG